MGRCINLERAWKNFINKSEEELMRNKLGQTKKPFLKKRYCRKCDNLFSTYAKDSQVCEKCKEQNRTRKNPR